MSHKYADYSRLCTDNYNQIVYPESSADVTSIIKNSKYSKIVIRGTKKSHGGHVNALTKHATVDITTMNNIESLKDKILVVQAGCTWEHVQNYLNEFFQSPICQQSSFDFTVGGSVAGNCHGRDVRHSAIESSIEWIELITSDGITRKCSRTNNSELFWNIFGSFGCFGFISRIGLRVCDNSLLAQNNIVINTSQLNEWFENNKHSITLFMARPDVGNCMKKINVSFWTDTNRLSNETLRNEQNVIRDKLIFWLSNKSNLLLRMRWKLEVKFSNKKPISRSNAMRPPITPLKMFETNSKNFTYVVQEIFIPKNTLDNVLDKISDLNKGKKHLRLAGVTIRHLSNQKSSSKSLNQKDGWAIMMYWKISKNQLGMGKYSWLQNKLVHTCIEVNGKINLNYASLIKPDDVLEMYPVYNDFIRLKTKLDKKDMFTSQFISKLQSQILDN